MYKRWTRQNSVESLKVASANTPFPVRGVYLAFNYHLHLWGAGCAIGNLTYLSAAAIVRCKIKHLPSCCACVDNRISSSVGEGPDSFLILLIEYELRPHVLGMLQCRAAPWSIQDHELWPPWITLDSVGLTLCRMGLIIGYKKVVVYKTINLVGPI